MADDTQWPSENEDFDAVVTNATPQQPKRKSVAIVSHDEQPDEAVPKDASSTDTDDAINDDSSNDIGEEVAAANEPTNEPAETQSSTEQPPIASAPIPAATPAKTNSGKSTFGFRTVFEALLVVAIIGLAFLAWTTSNNNKTLKKEVTKLNSNPQLIIQKQTDELIRKVGRLIDLPRGETPTVANVSDAEQAKKQSAFFNNAQNGDRVLMYVKAGQAILYRPSTDKIILVAPLTFSNNTPASTATTSPTTTSPTKTTR